MASERLTLWKLSDCSEMVVHFVFPPAVCSICSVSSANTDGISLFSLSHSCGFAVVSVVLMFVSPLAHDGEYVFVFIVMPDDVERLS